MEINEAKLDIFSISGMMGASGNMMKQLVFNFDT